MFRTAALVIPKPVLTITSIFALVFIPSCHNIGNTLLYHLRYGSRSSFLWAWLLATALPWTTWKLIWQIEYHHSWDYRELSDNSREWWSEHPMFSSVSYSWGRYHVRSSFWMCFDRYQGCHWSLSAFLSFSNRHVWSSGIVDTYRVLLLLSMSFDIHNMNS